MYIQSNIEVLNQNDAQIANLHVHVALLHCSLLQDVIHFDAYGYM